MDRMDCLNEANGEAVGLLTTYRCNLNCKYCYVQTKRNKDMALDMAKSILEPFLLKKAGRLDITFMGGETLLAIEVIRPLVEWVESGKYDRIISEYRAVECTHCGEMIAAKSEICPICGGEMNL